MYLPGNFHELHRMVGFVELMRHVHQAQHGCKTSTCEQAMRLKTWRWEAEAAYAEMAPSQIVIPRGDSRSMRERLVHGLECWPIAKKKPAAFAALCVVLLTPGELAMLEELGAVHPVGMQAWARDLRAEGGLELMV